MIDPLPRGFVHRIDRPWLDKLPVVLDECRRRWDVEIGPPYPDLSYHYVAPARRSDGSTAVIKIGDPNGEFANQVAVLRLFNGRSVVRLLECAADIGAILLERATPGETLSTLTDTGRDDEAVRIGAEMMQALWSPVPENCTLPRVSDWAQGLGRRRRELGGGTGPIPASLFEAAERLFRELLDGSGEPKLLHGDLHHFNILSAQRAPWLAIDPKGVVGEPGFEIGPFLRNPSLQSHESLVRRLDLLSHELKLDRDRLAAWALAEGVLSASWYIEDAEVCPPESIEYCRRIAAIAL